MTRPIVTLNSFANEIHKILLSDRDVNVGVGGFTGEGKSTFTTLLGKAYAKISGAYWGFDQMTWSRKEMMEWIDGKKNSKIDPETGLKENQLPEYSLMIPDELFLMFYRRNWYDDDQIDAIATFNMCRDRHLFLCGNIPNFWDLDGAFTSRIRFYIYIPVRGIAWVFEQENNPFSTDNWNATENKKKFRKKKNPYGLPNFLFEIHFPDWNPEEKKDYLAIRNEKRLMALSDNKGEKKERYGQVKKQRNEAIKYHYFKQRKLQKLYKDIQKLWPEHQVLAMPEDIRQEFQRVDKLIVDAKHLFDLETHKEIAELVDMNRSTISYVLES